MEPNFSPSLLESEAKPGCVMGRPFSFPACSFAPVDRKDFLAEKCRVAVSRPTVSRARTAVASE